LTEKEEPDNISTSKYLIWRFLMPTHFRGDEHTALALDTFIKFTRAANALENRLVHRGTLDDLTPSQFGILETLYHLGPLCQGAISEKLLKSTGNITLVLDNLEKRGLVERKRDQSDRRMVMIFLTATGAALIEEVFPRHAGSITAEFSVLSDDEQKELGRLCKKLGMGAANSSNPIIPPITPNL
jgi:MarR family transcriptional regulator, 2-MHQ and catechol-resistance regulon repressor